VDGVRVGRGLRTIRLRLGKRQADIAQTARVSRSFVAKVESGRIEDIDLRRLEAVCRAVGATLDLRIRWHGEHMDRLLDEAHSLLVNELIRRLDGLGWRSLAEHSFNEFGERGSIDVLAWHEPTRSVVVIEVKSLIADGQEALFSHDRKARLAPKLARDLGWDPAQVGRLLVLADTTSNRRHIDLLAATFGAAYPTRGDRVRGWLRAPSGSMSGLMFVPYGTADGVGAPPAGRSRVVPPLSRPRRRHSSPVMESGPQWRPGSVE
jgi:transcriptional regulator with XRE-family HTH domain